MANPFASTGEEVRLIGGNVEAVGGLNSDGLLHHVQANISGVVRLGGKNLCRSLEIIPGEERGCARVRADAGIFKGAREREELRLTGESDTQCVEIDGRFSHSDSAQCSAQEFHVQHFVVKDFRSDIGDTRVGEGYFGAAGCGAGSTGDGGTQIGTGNSYAIKLCFEIF